ncbi:hypothetical protein [Lysobacter sp. GCM10012299]|uniref:hypothetical protein n=1 Tax=Lysobacter sp. GCM10012299 TaxID=3317333 RepID=UPI00361F2481
MTFAGIAYTGAADHAKRALPIVDTEMKDRLPEINRQLRDGLTARPPANFDVNASQLAELAGSSSAIVMAVALDRETATVERIGDKYKVLFELAGQVLFFDFRERQVLFSYPVTLQHITALPTSPTPTEKAAIANQIVFGSGPSDLTAVVADTVANLALPGSSSRRIQLVDVRLAPAVGGKVSQAMADSALIGHEFSKILASTLRLPMLPHAQGQAIGGAMAARFADGTAYTLRIPEPDYRMVLDVVDFRQKTLSETPAVRRQLYGAFFNLRVEEPLSSTVYFDQPLRQGSTIDIPSTQEDVDTDAAYYETLIAGFSSMSQAINGGAAPWAGEQTGGRDFTKQLKSLKELIAKCR